MRGQMCEGCCGFSLTKKSEFWKEVSDGSFGLNKDKLQIKERNQTAHLSLYVHFCAARVTETCCRSEEARRHRKQRGKERRNKKQRRKRRKDFLPRR